MYEVCLWQFKKPVPKQLCVQQISPQIYEPKRRPKKIKCKFALARIKNCWSAVDIWIGFENKAYIMLVLLQCSVVKNSKGQNREGNNWEKCLRLVFALWEIFCINEKIGKLEESYYAAHRNHVIFVPKAQWKYERLGEACCKEDKLHFRIKSKSAPRKLSMCSHPSQRKDVQIFWSRFKSVKRKFCNWNYN